MVAIETVMVIGNGAREHALVSHLARQPDIRRIVALPGNAGIAQEPKTECMRGAIDEVSAVVAVAVAERVDLVIVGPELPLTLGLCDALEKESIMVFGPSASAARLEGEKSFSKQFFIKHNILTPRAIIATTTTQALSALEQFSYPLVLKANGLAAGKGVSIATDYQEAKQTIDALMVEKQFGNAGSTMVIEEFLTGFELSMIAMVWDQHYVLLDSAQDYKRLGNADTGPNTGGMGAICPHPHASPALLTTIETDIIKPTVEGLLAEGISYRGFLYAGLMVVKNRPYILEYNCRLGDPEAQVILARLKTPLHHAVVDLSNGKSPTLAWDSRIALGVVMATQGYPLQPKKGVAFSLPSPLAKHTTVLHAATDRTGNGLVANGGRSLSVVALGDTLSEASEKAYHTVAAVSFPQSQYRTDIGNGVH